MYLKVSILNSLLQLKVFNASGNDITNTITNVRLDLFNKNEDTYELIRTVTTSTFQLNTKELTSNSFIYVSIYLNGILQKEYQKVMLTNDLIINRYNISYQVKPKPLLTTNLLLDRYNYFMPKWSTAYKNDISVFSKIYSALFEPVEKALYRSKTFTSININNTDSVKYKEVTLPSSLKCVKSENTVLTQTDTQEKNSITKLSLENTSLKIKNLFNNKLLYDTEIGYPILMTKNFNHLFIKSSTKCTIIINGFDLNNNYCTETITLNNHVPFCSKFKYSKITDIISTSKDILISNYIDCIHNLNCQKFNESYLNIGFNKTIENPEIILDYENNRLNYYYIKETSNLSELKDSYLLPENLDIKQLYITSDNDILLLTNEGTLHTGLVRKNLETSMEFTTYNNNNIYLSAPKVLTTNSVEFQINSNFLIEDYGNISAKVKLTTDKEILYLNEVGDWEVTEKFIVMSNPNPIYIELDIESCEYCSLTIELENNEIFQASVRNDKIYLRENLNNISSMIYNGNDLYVVQNFITYKLKLNKDYYEYTDKTVKYIGEKSLKIYDNRGLIIDV